MDNYRCTFIDADEAVTVKTGAGALHAIVLGNEPTGSDIEIWDSAGSGGRQLGVLKNGVDEGTFTFDCGFATGLHIVNAGGGKMSVIYR